MSISQTDLLKPSSEKYMLELFTADVANRLTQHALDAIRPKVHEVAVEVARGMESRLRSALDPMYDRVIVQLVVKETK